MALSPASRQPSITVVVPTFREVESLPHLLDRLGEVRAKHGLDLDVLVMDDDSRDGTEELIAQRPEPWIRLIVRRSDRGLSAAVLDGFRAARGEVLACMDADLSHPPEKLPEMVRALDDGYDFVLGSRYVDGGTTADDWGFFRWVNSRVATLLARPFTSVTDPLSGFFVLRRETFEEGTELNPLGYKIALELIVKCRCRRVGEVPIHFSDRRFGESKLTLHQQLLYLLHIRRLAVFRFGTWPDWARFLLVGLSGTFVNLATLTLLLALGIAASAAIVVAIGVSMLSNFVLHRRLYFAHTRRLAWHRQLRGYVFGSLIGATINVLIATRLLALYPALLPQLAALGGIGAGVAWNFLLSRYFVFRMKHVRVDSKDD